MKKTCIILLALLLIIAARSPAAAESVGGPCAEDAQCEEGLQCLPEEYIASGYCTITECERAGCPEGSICYEIDAGLSACLKLCTEDAECRVEEGHTCSPEMDACWGDPGETTEETTTTTTSIAVTGSFSYRVDPSIIPIEESLPGMAGRPERPVAAVRNPDGRQDDFIVNEVILYDPDDTLIQSLQESYGAEILDNGDLPDAPEDLSTDQYDAETTRSDYRLVSVNLEMADTSEFESWMTQLEFEGEFVFSSDEAVWLSAIIAKERVVNGLNITPNMVASATTPDCVISETEEHSWHGSTTHFRNAFDDVVFPWVTDTQIGLIRAWQYFDLLDLNLTNRDMGVAVIDGGFHTNNDFKIHAQLDMVDDDNYVLDQNGGSGWHGTSVLSAMAARIDNQFGSVGTGGLVFEPDGTGQDGPARPLLFRAAEKGKNYKVSFWDMSSAVEKADKWGGEVINISMGGECGWFCRNFGIFSGMDSLTDSCRDARDRGLIVVCSAGNQEDDLDDSTYLPCEIDATLCVGALDLASKNAVSSSNNTWGSNYGSKVDIWAPGENISVTPNPDTLGNGLDSADGTSLASPYIAGLAVMMKAINSSITLADVKSVLQSTANTSSDSRVKYGYVNAFEAIKKVASNAGKKVQGDSYEPNDSQATAAKISTNTFTATIAMGEGDYYYLETTDYLDLSVTVTYQDTETSGNNVMAEFNSTALSEPTTGTLTTTVKMLPPGKQILHVYGGTNAMNCYTVTISSTASFIIPDKYDLTFPYGDDFAGRAVISEKVNATTAMFAMSYIYDLNFDQTNDIDFFEITLGETPDECLDPSTQGPDFVQGQFSIQTFPALPLGPASIAGVQWPFEIKVYNSDKSEFTTYTSKSGYNLKIECPHTYFKDGKIIFSVTAKDGRRNFYDIGLYYNAATSIGYIPDIFDDVEPGEVWVVPPWEQVILDWLFPSNPVTIDQYFAGELGNEIPAEYGVLQWEQAGDLDLYMFTDGQQNLQLTLYDENKQVLGTTGTGSMYRLMALDEQGEGEQGHIHVADLPAGTYVLEFNQGDFGTVYSLSIGEEASVLTVHNEGTGSGTVTSEPGGIQCGGSCEEAFQHGTPVQLTATAHEGSQFSGWESEQCSGTDNCTFTMDEGAEITARFSSEDVEASGISVEPGNHYFGVVRPGEQSESEPFFVKNNSEEEVIIGVAAIAGESAEEYAVLEENCTAESLQPEDECLVEVVFIPQSEGVKPAVLFIQAESSEPVILEAELLGEAFGEGEHDDGEENGDDGDDDDDNDEGGCPVAHMLDSNKQHLESLYRFRDDVLKVNKKGAAYSELYYDYQDELTELFSQHPELFSRAQNVLLHIIPVIENRIISQGPYTEGLELLEDIVTASKGSLKQNLIHLQQDLQTGILLEKIGIEVE